MKLWWILGAVFAVCGAAASPADDGNLAAAMTETSEVDRASGLL